MENAITLKSTMPEFKSKDLNTATSAIFKAIKSYNKTATETRKTVSIVLARVEKNKTYKEDGFKSLAEYAETIGLDKSLAHKMENAGRLLTSENSSIRDFAERSDYSKLAILSSVNQDELAKAIDDGKLTPANTQAEVKAWKADNAAKSTKEKILPNFHVRILKGNGDTVEYDSIAIENVTEIDGYQKIGAYERAESDGEKWDVYVNPRTMETVQLWKDKVKTSKAKNPVVKDITKMTYEEIMEYMSRMKKADE